MDNTQTARTILDELSKTAGDENVRLRAAELLLIHGEPVRNQEEKVEAYVGRAMSVSDTKAPEGVVSKIQTSLYDAHSILHTIDQKLDELIGSMGNEGSKGSEAPKAAVAYGTYSSADALVDRLNLVRERLSLL